MKRVAYWLVGTGITFTAALPILYLKKTTPIDSSLPIDHDIFASYGTVVGGVLGALFSLAGIFLLIATLESQERAISTQDLSTQRQLFEGKFFDMIKIHRENCSEMNLKDRTGRKVFLTLQREFYQCKLIVDALNETSPFKLSEPDRVNIAYLTFFFGAVGEMSEPIIKDRLRAYPDHAPTLLKNFKQSQTDIANGDNMNYVPFEGHQSRLSHYFRHLFQTVKYVDQQPQNLLTYPNKYNYLKILRAQLSNTEQAFLFFNSLSDIGAAWEREASIEENRKLITKYNLIKNIPHGYTIGLDVRTYYPHVRFEGDPLTAERIELEKRYW